MPYPVLEQHSELAVGEECGKEMGGLGGGRFGGRYLAGPELTNGQATQKEVSACTRQTAAASTRPAQRLLVARL